MNQKQLTQLIAQKLSAIEKNPIQGYDGGAERCAKLLAYYCKKIWERNDYVEIINCISHVDDFAMTIPAWPSILYMSNSDFIVFSPDGTSATLFKDWEMLGEKIYTKIEIELFNKY